MKGHDMKAVTRNEPHITTERDSRQQFVAPEVNIFETNDGYVLQAEMPGVNKLANSSVQRGTLSPLVLTVLATTLIAGAFRSFSSCVSRIQVEAYSHHASSSSDSS